MTIKCGGLLGVLAFACSMGVAAAQDAATGPVGPDVLKRLSQGVPQGPAAKGVSLGGGGATLNAPGGVAIGVHYFHATNCQWFTDGFNNWIYVFPIEGGFWFYLNSLYVSNIFETACANGNWVAINVIDSLTGNFDWVYTYPFK